MTRRRAATGLSGILLVDKPQGMTSHDVANAVRHATGEGRVGHAGTLDPLATGLLVVLVGPATRLAPWLSAAEKSYEALIVFGAETDTDDAEGAVSRTADVPELLGDAVYASQVVSALEGEHLQTPPSYSAIKVAGRTAHKVARAGGEIALEPRRVTVHHASFLGVRQGQPPAWEIALTVSKGTYVRALARDLGRALGTAAHLGALRRTRCGALDVEDAVTLEQIEAAQGHISELFTDSISALGMPVVSVDEKGAALVSHGAALPRQAGSGLRADDTVAVAHEGRLLAVYGSEGAYLRPLAVLPGGAA